MPQGTYLTGWGQGSFDDTQPVYHRLLQYAKEHGLTIAGNAYEERLIDEVEAFDKEMVPNVKRDGNNRRIFDERDVRWI